VQEVCACSCHNGDRPWLDSRIYRFYTQIVYCGLQVKQSMKRHKSNKTLQRVLHSRQLGLKLIANVTYGYTSANFSGRMPCIEVVWTYEGFFCLYRVRLFVCD
jgi:DNA polymerase elongation subunit (family B)